MSALRDRRTPAEVEACAEMRRQHTWPWPLLCDAVWHLAENTGLTTGAIAHRLRVPWPWIERQYANHHEPLPYSVRIRQRLQGKPW